MSRASAVGNPAGQHGKTTGLPSILRRSFIFLAD